LTDFKAPLELFSLEEEAALLPGGLFVFSASRVKLSFTSLLGTISGFIRITSCEFVL